MYLIHTFQSLKQSRERFMYKKNIFYFFCSRAFIAHTVSVITKTNIQLGHCV